MPTPATIVAAVLEIDRQRQALWVERHEQLSALAVFCPRKLGDVLPGGDLQPSIMIDKIAAAVYGPNIPPVWRYAGRVIRANGAPGARQIERTETISF